MKVIDTIVYLLLGGSIMVLASIWALMVYILMLIVLVYKAVRGKIDFIKEVRSLNKEYVNQLRNFINIK